MKITIYADTLEDADRAFRLLKQKQDEAREKYHPSKRECVIWSSIVPGDDWRALIWGDPSHWRVDCRRMGGGDE